MQNRKQIFFINFHSSYAGISRIVCCWYLIYKYANKFLSLGSGFSLPSIRFRVTASSPPKIVFTFHSAKLICI